MPIILCLLLLLCLLLCLLCLLLLLCLLCLLCWFYCGLLVMFLWLSSFSYGFLMIFFCVPSFSYVFPNVLLIFWWFSDSWSSGLRAVGFWGTLSVAAVGVCSLTLGRGGGWMIRCSSWFGDEPAWVGYLLSDGVGIVNSALGGFAAQHPSAPFLFPGMLSGWSEGALAPGSCLSVIVFPCSWLETDAFARDEWITGIGLWLCFLLCLLQESCYYANYCA